jgi:thiamine biosynthesis lipoprotein
MVGQEPVDLLREGAAIRWREGFAAFRPLSVVAGSRNGARGAGQWLASLAVLAAIEALALGSSLRAETARSVRRKMGTRFEVTAVHPDAAAAWHAVEAAYAEIDRLEALISEWIESSEVSALNRNAGVRPQRVSPEVLALVQRALAVSRLTDGAFDVTFLSVGRLWDFKAAHPVMPDPAAIRAALAGVGADKVVIDAAAGTVFLRDPRTRIGFGGIGQGWAANAAARLMRAHGATGGVVNASGDVLAFGRREDGRPWRIGIANPLDRDRVFGYLDVTDGAVVTSGDYESFVVIDGERFSHILDPRTGYPAKDVRSATVICPDAELADALATGVSVMGVEKGLALLDALNGVEGLLVDERGKIHLSKNLAGQIVDREER